MLELERGLVDHQARADVHDLLDLDQLVGLERLASRHQVDDGVGQAGQRRQLHRAVELDEVHVHALLGEEVARNRRVLGGHAQARAGLDAGVVKALGHGHAHAALGNLQVQRLVQADAAMLDQRVLAGHADVGAAVFHVGGHVGGAHQHHLHVGLVGGQDQLARGFWVFRHLDAGSGQQGQGFVKDAAFGEGKCDHDEMDSQMAVCTCCRLFFGGRPCILFEQLGCHELGRVAFQLHAKRCSTWPRSRDRYSWMQSSLKST